MKPRIQQLHQSGALDGQVPIWDSSLGYWVPGDPAPVTTACRATLVADGGETVLDLGVAPMTSTELVFVNGQLLTWGVDYTISGSEVTFDVALTAADRVSVAYTSDGSCGTASLVPPSAPFDPLTLSGMILWLDAGTLSLADNDPIGTLADQSGNGNDGTASGGARPTFKTGIVNGLPVVRMTSGNYLATNASASETAHTVVAVVRPSGSSGYRPIIGSGPSTGGLLWDLTASSNVPRLVKTYVTAIGAATTGLSTSTFQIAAATFTAGASYEFFLDGTTDGSGSHGVTLSTGRTVYLGHSPQDGTYFEGDIAELFVFDTVLSSGDLADLTGYLQAKYSL